MIGPVLIKGSTTIPVVGASFLSMFFCIASLIAGAHAEDEQVTAQNAALVVQTHALAVRVDAIARFLSDQTRVEELAGCPCLVDWKQPELDAYKNPDSPTSYLPECVSECESEAVPVSLAAEHDSDSASEE